MPNKQKPARKYILFYFDKSIKVLKHFSSSISLHQNELDCLYSANIFRLV